MDTTRAMTAAVQGGAALGGGIEPSGFEEGGEEGRNPLMVLHLLLQGRYWWTAALAMVLAVAGAVAGYKLTPVSFSSMGMIHIKPVMQVFTPTGQGNDGVMLMFESFMSAQVQLLKSERVVDMAMSSERWRE